MTDLSNQKSDITNAPLDKEEDEQVKVPPEGESIIGKGHNRKPFSTHERREQLSTGDNQDL